MATKVFVYLQKTTLIIIHLMHYHLYLILPAWHYWILEPTSCHEYITPSHSYYTLCIRINTIFFSFCDIFSLLIAFKTWFRACYNAQTSKKHSFNVIFLHFTDNVDWVIFQCLFCYNLLIVFHNFKRIHCLLVFQTSHCLLASMLIDYP